MGKRIGVTKKDFRGRVNILTFIPLRVIVWPNRDYFKLFMTKDPNENENFISISFNDKIEILTEIKQIFDPHLDPYGEELWEIDENIKY